MSDILRILVCFTAILLLVELVLWVQERRRRRRAQQHPRVAELVSAVKARDQLNWPVRWWQRRRNVRAGSAVGKSEWLPPEYNLTAPLVAMWHGDDSRVVCDLRRHTAVVEMPADFGDKDEHERIKRPLQRNHDYDVPWD